MANRKKEIILYFLNNEIVIFDKLLKELNISRRTLYYDISKINNILEGYGEIVKIGTDYKLVGNFEEIENIILRNITTGFEMYLEYEIRKKKILTDIFNGKRVTIGNMASEMILSKTTIVQTIKKLKNELAKKEIDLKFDNGYRLSGNETSIRDIYLQTNVLIGNIFSIDSRTIEFNKKTDLGLTDYSKHILSNFVNFIKLRNDNGYFIDKNILYEDTRDLLPFTFMDLLLEKGSSSSEKKYLAAYISTLSGLNKIVNEDKIVKLVSILVLEIEQKMVIAMNDKDECIHNLSRHLLSSYNRIKYNFPAINPLMNEIKVKYRYLFRMIKNIFKTTESLLDLKDIRDEEIAFIVSYIGAYIEHDAIKILNNRRVMIVCPNGMTVTKSIQYQLENYFPDMNIIRTLSYSDLKKYELKEYDWIISTIELENIQNVIVVNPILKNSDLSVISNKLFRNLYYDNHISIKKLVETFEKYGDIKNEDELIKELYSLYFKSRICKGGNPMLKELITLDKIKIVDKVKDWETGIRLASEVLVKQGTIEPSYVDAIISGVNEFGPYIVLTDYFALAHARPEHGVNRLSMSLLKVNTAFDMKGKEVKIIVVLAATDNKKHIKALASITEIFMEEENVEKIMNTDSIDIIFELIEKYS